MMEIYRLLDWLNSPLSGAMDHAIEPWAYWHARLMVVSWSFLLPIGMIVARFFKVTPNQDWPRELDNRFWWLTHLRTQSVGVAAMTLGLALAWGHGRLSNPSAQIHHFSGWVLCIAGWAQILGGLLRGSKGGPTAANLRGDHYDMTSRRVVFEYVHKHLGWGLVPFVIVTTGLGLKIVDAPRWMPIALGLWWAVLIGALVVLQRAGWCLDTYFAIWGPDPTLPGAKRRPIGLGISRKWPRAPAGER